MRLRGEQRYQGAAQCSETLELWLSQKYAVETSERLYITSVDDTLGPRTKLK